MDTNRPPRELRRFGRRPLADATARVNNSQARHHEDVPSVHSSPFKAQSPINSSPEHPRISAVINDFQQPSNRNSQISTTSTNATGNPRRKTHVGPWRLGKTLGYGSTARVRRARHAVTGQLAAVKIVSKTAAADVQRTSSLKGKRQLTVAGAGEDRQLPFGIEREVVIMKLIEHPNVVRLYDVWENRGEL